MKLRACCGKFVFRGGIFETVMLLGTETACRLSKNNRAGAIRRFTDWGIRNPANWEIERMIRACERRSFD